MMIIKVIELMLYIFICGATAGLLGYSFWMLTQIIRDVFAKRDGE